MRCILDMGVQMRGVPSGLGLVATWFMEGVAHKAILEDVMLTDLKHVGYLFPL